MSKRASPTLIGAFVLGAIALALVSLLVFGSGRFFRSTHEYVLYFDGSVNGLLTGAPVKWKGVQVGSVSRILMGYQQPADDTRVAVFVELDERNITRDSPQGSGLDARVDELIGQGLRGRLEMQSLLTGLLYVGFDLHPDTPDTRIRPPGSYPPEIPTVRTPLEKAQATVEEVLQEIRDADLDQMVRNLTAAVAGLERLLNSEDLARAVNRFDNVARETEKTFVSVRELLDSTRAEVGPIGEDVRATAQQTQLLLERAEATLRSTQDLLDPDAPLANQLATTLLETERSARALRELADSLERDPSSLLFGRRPAAEERQ